MNMRPLRASSMISATEEMASVYSVVCMIAPLSKAQITRAGADCQRGATGDAPFPRVAAGLRARRGLYAARAGAAGFGIGARCLPEALVGLRVRVSGVEARVAEPFPDAGEDIRAGSDAPPPVGQRPLDIAELAAGIGTEHVAGRVVRVHQDRARILDDGAFGASHRQVGAAEVHQRAGIRGATAEIGVVVLDGALELSQT